MLLNRAWEAVRAMRLGHRLLAGRARAVAERVPVILIPSVLGVRLRGVWGGLRELYRARPPGDGQVQGLLDGFAIVPGLWSYDCYGGLMRFLARVGGYRPGEDLHVLNYDWRTGLRDGAARLAELVERLQGAGREKVDLIGVSTGGLVARAFLAAGTSTDGGSSTGASASSVRRVIHVGVPQGGSLHDVEMLATGVRPAPLGRRFSGADVGGLQTAWDCLPHPGEPVFVDEQGRPLPFDLYQPATWRTLGMSALPEDELAVRLGQARELRALLDRSAAHPDTVVIGGRNLPTAIRARVRDGRVEFPPCEPPRGDPLNAILYAPGDSAVPASSLGAQPGLAKERFWWVRPAGHHLLPAHPDVHRLVLEALLAPRVERVETRRRLAVADG
jgi:hypothetical protein